MMNKAVSIGLLLLGFLSLNAQETEMNTTDVWSNPSAWDNGIPDGTTNVNVTGSLLNIILSTVDGDAACNDLIMTLGSITINNEVNLTINGQFEPSLFGTVTNNGELQMRGNLIAPFAGTKLTINGGITIFSGLEVPGLTIE